LGRTRNRRKKEEGALRNQGMEKAGRTGRRCWQGKKKENRSEERAERSEKQAVRDSGKKEKRTGQGKREGRIEEEQRRSELGQLVAR
jgi:hypothetical protein